jgi:hypothetical protein
MMAEFANQVNKSVLELMDGMHTAIPAKIADFDAAKCEATVAPYGKLKKPDGTFMDYPKIGEVPCIIPQGNGQKTSMAFPIRSGDECLLIVSEYTLDTWRGGGAESANDLRFDLTNAIALVGLFSKPNPVVAEAIAEDALILANGSSRIIVKSGEIILRGNVRVEGNVQFEGNAEASQDLTVTGTTTSGGIDLNTHTHPYTWTDDGGAGDTSPPE